MKIAKSRIRQLINESVQKILKEQESTEGAQKRWHVLGAKMPRNLQKHEGYFYDLLSGMVAEDAGTNLQLTRDEMSSMINSGKLDVDVPGVNKISEQLPGVRMIYPVLSKACLLYTSPSPRDGLLSRMPSSA